MAEHERRHSITKNVVKVQDFHSFLDSSNEADDRAKVAKLYDEWTSYEADVKEVNYRGPGESGIILSHYIADKSASILDCGAGTGLVGEVLHSLGFTNITALDISQKSLDIAASKNVYSQVVCTNVGKEQMPFSENEFDALVCVGCFSPGHMNHECFPDWIRVTKPGGLIFLVMRESFLNEGEFREGFPRAVQDLVNSQKWAEVATQPIPDYFDMHMGVALIFRVL